METNSNAPCLECAKTLKGRTDKKFCDDYCRNNYNNKLNSDKNKVVRNINNILRRNRRILEQLLSGNEEFVKINVEKLISANFDFKYCTHIYTTQKGQQYNFCYEYGYLRLEQNKVLIVRRLKDDI